MVADALRRLGGIDDPPVVGRARRCRPSASAPPSAPRWSRAGPGSAATTTTSVVVPESCLVAHPRLDELLVGGDFAEATEVTLRIGGATGERLAVRRPDRRRAWCCPRTCWSSASTALQAGRRAWIHDEVAGRRWRISARSFFQTRTDGAEALVDAVARAAGDALRRRPRGRRLRRRGPARRQPARRHPARRASAGRPRPWSSSGRRRRSPTPATTSRTSPVRVVKADVDRWSPSPADLVVADPSRVGPGQEGGRPPWPPPGAGAGAGELRSGRARPRRQAAGRRRASASSGPSWSTCSPRPTTSRSCPASSADRIRARLRPAASRRPSAPYHHANYADPNPSTTSPTPSSSSASAGTRSRRWPRPTAATPARCSAWPGGCWATRPWPRRSCRRCSCACGTSPRSSTPSGASLRSYLLAQCHGRSVDLLRSETSRREPRGARRPPHRRGRLRPRARGARPHRGRTGQGRHAQPHRRRAQRHRAGLPRRPHLPRGRRRCSASPRAR